SETAGILTVVDTTTHRRLLTIPLPAGSRPMGAAMDPRGKKLYVSTGRAGTVCVVDPAAGQGVKTVARGKRPWGLAIAPGGERLYVTNGPSNDVSVLDLQTDTEIARIHASEGPWGIAIVAAPRQSPRGGLRRTAAR